MDSSELNDAAWDLVEHCRPALSVAELNTAFVRLGVGEYGEAMAVALKSIVRAAGPPLPAQLHSRLKRLQTVYYFDRDLIALLSVAPHVGSGRSGP